MTLTDQEITSKRTENMGIVMFTVRTSMCNPAGQDIDGTRGIRWWIDRRLFYDAEPSCNVLQRHDKRERSCSVYLNGSKLERSWLVSSYYATFAWRNWRELR